MAKIGKISTIKRDFSGSSIQTMEQSLANSKFKLTRTPGTSVTKFPYREVDGRYRTGLDPDASYIKRIQDPDEQKLEKDRVSELRIKLEAIFNVDLSPKAPFWNYALATSNTDISHVQPEKLIDGDNFFDFSNPWRELTFAWLRVHPTIASSYQAWERGEYPADTQFYVVDDEIENAVKFKKKQEINKAIVMFQDMTVTKKRKVARQLGLPVSEDTKEEVVYNLVDDLLKQTEFKNGKHQGLNPVRVFLQYATMKEDLLHIKDVIKQAIMHSVLRVKNGGKIFKGEFEMAVDEDALVKYLIDEDHQDDLLQLEQDIKTKKLAAV